MPNTVAQNKPAAHIPNLTVQAHPRDQGAANAHPERLPRHPNNGRGESKRA